MKLVKRGYNIRLYPNREQMRLLRSTFGCTRWLWNQFLAMQKERHTFSPESNFVSTYGMNYLLPCLKKEFPWLKDVDATALQKVSDDINAAYQNFFAKRAKRPKFKAKKHEQSYTAKCVKGNISVIDGHHIRLPKIGPVYYRGRMPKGKVKSVTVRQKPDGRILASVLCEVEVLEKVRTNQICGADMGLHDLIVLSDGRKFSLPRYDKELEDRLKHWQRKASRRLLKAKKVMKADPTSKLTDFQNYQKARRMVAKYHAKISNRRIDHLHKVTTWLVENYDVIVIEDLKTKNLMKNHKLARAIANASWGELTRLLEYKCAWYGKTLIKVDPAYTSQECHACGCINSRLNLSPYRWLKVREWQCPDCGTIHDRDINAAVNIMNKGLAFAV